ncbi:MAG: DUF1566 domain-containing protein [Archangium sp.]|nr:DUF1566 domain-containing protein [Archangium sp.]
MRQPLVVCVALLAFAAEAGAPPGRYTLEAERVRDTTASLTWQRAASGPMAFSDAQAACAGASPSGWRLPTIKELQTLVDYRAVPPAPAIDAAAFPSTPGEAFWSSTPLLGSASTVWVVDFATGVTATAATSAMGRVRCVR